MNLHQLFLKKNDCYKAGRTIIPKGIMVHSTGANNPNLRRYVGPDDGLLGRNTGGNHWNTATPGGSQVCVHAFIGKLKDGTIATYQTLPWNYRGWHAGGAANNTHIGFEICEDGLSDSTYFQKVYREASSFVPTSVVSMASQKKTSFATAKGTSSVSRLTMPMLCTGSQSMGSPWTPSVPM